MADINPANKDEIHELKKKIRQLESQLESFKTKSSFFDEHLQHVPSIYYRFNIEKNRFDYISPKNVELTGYSVEEYMKWSSDDAIENTHPDDVDKALSRLAALNASGKQSASDTIVYRRKIKNGSYIYVSDNITLLKDENNKPICYFGYVTDITEQKVKEEKWQKERKLNQFVFDSNPNLISVKDSDGRYVMANKAFASFFEIDQDQLLQRLNADIDLKTNFNLYNKSEKEVLETGKSVTYEEKFTSPSGRVYYLQTTKAPLIIPGEEPFLLVNSTNITEKKIAENNLKRSETLYKNLINSLNFPFFMLDTKGKLMVINKAGIEWLNLNNKKADDLYWHEIDYLKKISDTSKLDPLAIKDASECETQIIKNNIPVWLWCNIQPMLDHQQEKVGVQIIILDITARKNATDKLIRNERTFKGILNASPDHIFLLDSNLQLITANQAALNYHNMVLDEMQQNSAVGLFGEEHGNTMELLAQRVQKTKHIQHEEMKIKGDYRAISMYPIFDQNNQVEQIAVMIRDVTALKKAEEETKRTLTIEKELNQLRSGVISTVSHEFRTPLAVILSNIQVVQKYHQQLMPEQRDTKYNLIYSSINQLDYMLDNISLLDKNARGLLRYNPSEIVLETELQQMVEELNSIAGTTNRIKTNFMDNVGKVWMDPMLLRHILSNLLSNALKFSEEQEPVDLCLTLLPENKVKFEVADRGRGIDKKEIENIWQPFFRGTNAEGIKGTGIGISIVKSCTDLCGGKINIESAENNGTRVAVVLPYNNINKKQPTANTDRNEKNFDHRR